MQVRNTTKEAIENPFIGLMSSLNIPAQEAQGQRELINSTQLPSKLGGYGKEGSAFDQYEKMGIKVVGLCEGDSMFADVQLPGGWEKRSTGHSMWNELVDDKGRVRANFFYKAAFYDRDAFINFNNRYEKRSEYVNTKEANNYDKFYCVKDNATGEIIFKTGITKEISDSDLAGECIEYLDKNFPNWQDLNAYWD